MPAPNQLKSIRDPRLDFFRGLALLIMIYDHLLMNAGEHVPAYVRVTPLSWGLAGAAAMFVFLSGQVFGIAYGRVLDRSGFGAVLRKVARRVLQLYVANAVTFALLLVVVLVALRFEGGAGPATHMWEALTDGRGVTSLMLGFLSLQVVPPLFDILLLYIILIGMGPLILWGLARHRWWTLGISLGLYLLVQFAPEATVPRFVARQIYFHPGAWQLLFVGGAALQRLEWNPRVNRWLVGIAGAVIAYVAIRKWAMPIMVAHVWVGESVWWIQPEDWTEVSRPLLTPVRLLYFGVLIYFVRAVLPPASRLWKLRLTHEIERLGRSALPVFCFHIVYVWMAAMIIGRIGGGWRMCVVAFVSSLPLLAVVAVIAQTCKRKKALPMAPERSVAVPVG